MKPTKVIILGKVYDITYTDKPSEVDIFKRESLWGQIDMWTRSIRIYCNNSSEEDLWHSILHEILHGIAEELHLRELIKEENHDQLDLLALALADVMFRNGWMK